MEESPVHEALEPIVMRMSPLEPAMTLSGTFTSGVALPATLRCSKALRASCARVPMMPTPLDESRPGRGSVSGESVRVCVGKTGADGDHICACRGMDMMDAVLYSIATSVSRLLL